MLRTYHAESAEKSCRKRSDLNCQMKTHKQREQNLQDPPGTVQNNILCRVCNKHCKSLSFKSDFRFYENYYYKSNLPASHSCLSSLQSSCIIACIFFLYASQYIFACILWYACIWWYMYMVICAYVLCVRLRDEKFRTQKMVWKCKIVGIKTKKIINCYFLIRL